MSAANWTEAHELAALERLFEIGLQRLRMYGLSASPTAVNLATCACSTEQEFRSALQNKARMAYDGVVKEVAHVYRVVAERSR